VKKFSSFPAVYISVPKVFREKSGIYSGKVGKLN